MADRSPIEMVRRLDTLTVRHNELEAWLRDGRLGRRPGVIRRVGWLPGGYADGWFGSDRFEELPRELYRAFFDFLTERSRKLAEEIRALRNELDELGVDRG